MGAPVDVAGATQSTVYLRRGCGDGTAEAWSDGGHAGISLSLRPDWVAVAEPGFNGIGRALVFEGTNLVGIVSRTDIVRILDLRTSLGPAHTGERPAFAGSGTEPGG